VDGLLPPEETENLILDRGSILDRGGFLFAGIGIRIGRRGRVMAMELVGDLVEQRFPSCRRRCVLRFIRHCLRKTLNLRGTALTGIESFSV